MNEKDIIKIIKEKEWKKFLTRPYNFSFVSLHARAYHKELKYIVGDNCHTLYIFSQGVVEIYRDCESVEKIKKNFYGLALQMIKLYEIVISIIYYKNLLDKTVKIDDRQSAKFFAHLTALPFNLGNTIIDNGLHEDSLNHKKILDICQEIRCLNYYHKFDSKYLKKQNDDFVYLAIGNRAYYSFKKQLVELARLCFAGNNQGDRAAVAKGTVAYRGKVTGKVRKIFNIGQGSEFQSGEILVSHSTNPELLPIMKKAGAIVTDEGGMMSHAAILSRELKIPCLVGAGNATKVFQNGDWVEVDAIGGVVRKI